MSNEFSSENIKTNNGKDNHPSFPSDNNNDHIHSNNLDNSDIQSESSNNSSSMNVDNCAYCLNLAMHNDIVFAMRDYSHPMRIRMVPSQGFLYDKIWRRTTSIQLYKNAFEIFPEITHEEFACVYEIMSRMMVAPLGYQPIYLEQVVVVHTLVENIDTISKSNTETLRYISTGPTAQIQMRQYIKRFADVIIESVNRVYREWFISTTESDALETIKEGIMTIIQMISRIINECPYGEWVKMMTKYNNYRCGVLPLINTNNSSNREFKSRKDDSNPNNRQKTKDAINNSNKPTESQHESIKTNYNKYTETKQPEHSSQQKNSSEPKNRNQQTPKFSFHDNGRMNDYENYSLDEDIEPISVGKNKQKKKTTPLR